ncbi:hypothetical protein WJX75_001967 [Coccomyxa subellipsoidea]|uniref:Uncharacterized protein n=1 Tax=Coccomyxa subellipsoidea TaxID=248742 RepID=A0ABR2YTE3_9CHLO
MDYLSNGMCRDPEADYEVSRLYTDGGATQKYPICFLTNGGGVTEAQKAQQLSNWLGVNVRENQVVLSHTPFRSLAKSLGSKPVLVAGVGSVAEVAREYGFKHVLTTTDIAHALHKAVPFWKNSPGHEAPAPGECPVRNLALGSAKRPIAAILVFKDPADWYLDLQIMTDVILGGGVPGRWKPRVADRASVPVYFSNPDLLWATDFPAPRFGQGAFAAALRTLYRQTTGAALEHQYYGKPNRAPYALAEELLLEQAIQLGQLPAGSGAEAAKPGNVVVDDVADAVEAALHRTRSSEWHSLR